MTTGCILATLCVNVRTTATSVSPSHAGDKGALAHFEDPFQSLAERYSRGSLISGQTRLAQKFELLFAPLSLLSIVS